MGTSAIRHACEHTRSHTPRLNPPAREVLIRPDANSLLRQGCTRMRSSRSGSVSCSLTAPQIVLDAADRQTHKKGIRVFLSLFRPPPRATRSN